MLNIKSRLPAIWKKLSIPLILFLCGFILTVNEKPEKIDPNCRAVISQSPQAEKDSRDVNPHSSTPNCTAVWMVAVDLGHSSVKQTHQKYEKTTGLTRLYHSKQEFNFTDSENTIAQVHSDLARQFTLLGEKPSGTS
jgi:hypothetical protein